MKLMPFLCLGIFFFDVSIGMPNPIETMIVEDRGKQHQQNKASFYWQRYIWNPNTIWKIMIQYKLLLGCSLSQGTVCGGYRITQKDCCKPGLSCQSNGYRGICEPIKKKSKVSFICNWGTSHNWEVW